MADAKTWNADKLKAFVETYQIEKVKEPKGEGFLLDRYPVMVDALFNRSASQLQIWDSTKNSYAFGLSTPGFDHASIGLVSELIEGMEAVESLADESAMTKEFGDLAFYCTAVALSLLEKSAVDVWWDTFTRSEKVLDEVGKRELSWSGSRTWKILLFKANRILDVNKKINHYGQQPTKDEDVALTNEVIVLAGEILAVIPWLAYHEAGENVESATSEDVKPTWEEILKTNFQKLALKRYAKGFSAEASATRADENG